MAEQFSPTVTPQGTGSAQVQAAQAETAVAKRPWDLFRNVVTQIPQAVGALSAQHKADVAYEEATQGQIKAATDMSDVSQLPVEEQDAFYSAGREKIANGESENSQAYDKAYMASTTSAFFSAKAEASRKKNLNSASAEVQGMVIPEMLPKGYDITTGIDHIAKKNGLKPAVVRSMYLGKQTDYFAGQMMISKTPEELAHWKSEVAANRKRLAGSNYYGSKSKEWQAEVRSSDAKVASAIKTAEAGFLNTARQNIVDAKGDDTVAGSFATPFTSVKDDFNTQSQGNPTTYDNESKAFLKDQADANYAREWTASFKPGDQKRGAYPTTDIFKQEHTKAVTAGILTGIGDSTGNSLGKVVDIIINDSDYIEQAGDDIMGIVMNSDDPAMLKRVSNSLTRMSHLPKGNIAMKKLLGPKEYARTLAVTALMGYGGLTDLAKARDIVFSEGVLNPETSPQYKALKQEYRGKLGGHWEELDLIMNVLEKNPAIAEKELAKVAEYVQGMPEKYAGAKVDKRLSNNTKLIFGDKVEESVKEWLPEDSTDMLMIGDQVLSLNKWGLTSGLMDIVQEDNKIVALEKAKADKKRKEAKESKGELLGDIQNRWLPGLGDFGDALISLPKTMLNRFTAHATKDMAKNREEFIEDLASVLGIGGGRTSASDFSGFQDQPDEGAPIEEQAKYWDEKAQIADMFNDGFDLELATLPTENAITNNSKVFLNSQLRTAYTETLEKNVKIKEKAVKASGENKIRAVVMKTKAATLRGEEMSVEGMSKDNIKLLQRTIDAKDDGIWGKGSQFKYDLYTATAPKGSRIFAVGKNQLIPDTLKEVVLGGYIKATDKFDEKTQDKAMDYLLEKKRPQITNYIKGNGNIDSAVLALAKEWASMPSPIKRGKGAIGDSYYGSGNKAGTTLKHVKEVLEKAKKTGDVKGLKALIAKHESAGAGYNAYNQGTKGNKIVAGKTKYKITDMTVAEILKAAENKQN